jgi:hypothetical protein
MTVRSFDWRDLAALHRYRNECLFLDNTRLLTVGPKILPAHTIFSYLSLSTGVFMYQSASNGAKDNVLLGQVMHNSGKSFSRLAFLTPASSIPSGLLPGLIERIVKDIGERGATHLIAEANEDEDTFEALRKSGFATYARQRIWQLTGDPIGSSIDTPWTPVNAKDLIGIRSLYANLVPGLVQQVEQPPAKSIRGFVLRQRQELLASVDIKYGPRGILVQPFIHPDLADVPKSLIHLLSNIPYRRSRPIYICVRSYQSWLEQAIENLGAEAGPRQAVMVRHLAIPQKNVRTYVYHALERGTPEVSAPITRRIIENYETTRDN